jgi:hypothetical protein
MTNKIAGPGEIFVCAACGRLSRDRDGYHKIHNGWDTSCRTHAVKYRKVDLVLDPKTKVCTGVKEGAKPVMEVLN